MAAAWSWVQAKAWWVVVILLAVCGVLFGLLMMQRRRSAWLEQARQSAEDRARAAAVRAEAQRAAAEAYANAAARAKRELAELRARDAVEQETVARLRREIAAANSAEEVMELWARTFGDRRPL